MDSHIRQRAVSLPRLSKAFFVRVLAAILKSDSPVHSLQKKQVCACMQLRHKNAAASSTIHWRKIPAELEKGQQKFYVIFRSSFHVTTSPASQVVFSESSSRKEQQPSLPQILVSRINRWSNWHYQAYFSQTWERVCVQKLVCKSHQLARLKMHHLLLLILFLSR